MPRLRKSDSGPTERTIDLTKPLRRLRGDELHPANLVARYVFMAEMHAPGARLRFVQSCTHRPYDVTEAEWKAAGHA